MTPNARSSKGPRKGRFFISGQGRGKKAPSRSRGERIYFYLFQNGGRLLMTLPLLDFVRFFKDKIEDKILVLVDHNPPEFNSFLQLGNLVGQGRVRAF